MHHYQVKLLAYILFIDLDMKQPEQKNYIPVVVVAKKIRRSPLLSSGENTLQQRWSYFSSSVTRLLSGANRGNPAIFHKAIYNNEKQVQVLQRTNGDKSIVTSSTPTCPQLCKVLELCLHH